MQGIDDFELSLDDADLVYYIFERLGLTVLPRVVASLAPACRSTVQVGLIVGGGRRVTEFRAGDAEIRCVGDEITWWDPDQPADDAEAGDSPS